MSGHTMRVAALIVFVTATGLSGCGGSGDSTSPAGAAASQPVVTGDSDADDVPITEVQVSAVA